MIFYTSDLHLGHKNIIEYENRPYDSVEEMDEALINNWNSKVTDKDEVWVLGDFCLKGVDRTLEYLNCLNGTIHLLKGNHDKAFEREKFYYELNTINMYGLRIQYEGYYKHMNDSGREVVLFHYPIMFWDGQDDRGSYHLYGHMHSTSHGGQQHPHPDAFNVGVDVNNYYPVTLDELLERRSKNDRYI